MANTQGYFGFSPIGLNNASAPTFGLSTRRIASGNGTAIYRGDPVVPVSAANGYIQQAGNSNTAQLAGIFWSCKYLSVSQGRTVWSKYWPGSDASGDVLAYVIDAPNAQFIVQANGSNMVITGSNTTWTYSPVGQLAQFTIGTGSTSTGQSGAYLSSVGTTNTFAFQIQGLVDNPPGANGTDQTSNYNYLIVGFNNEMLRSNGAVTGIS